MVEKICKALQIIQQWQNPQEESLPWRLIPSPYRIFLAEMLLVRTRTDVVARLFEYIFSKYPTVETLAKADEKTLREILRPLGLKKRVPYLIRAAQYLQERYEGRIPTTVEELKAIPGVGDYTAVAIAAFGYGLKAIPADVNILRFFARFLGHPMEHPTKGSKRLRAIVEEAARRCKEYSTAQLLDFTRNVCRPRRPRCAKCMLQKECHFYLNGFFAQQGGKTA